MALSSPAAQAKEEKMIHYDYEYQVVSFSLVDPALGEESPFYLNPKAISFITIIQDWDTAIQPVFQIKGTFPPILVKYIVLHKNTIKFNLRFDMIQKPNKDSSALNKDDKSVQTTTICNDTFITFLDESGSFPNLELLMQNTNTITGNRGGNVITADSEGGISIAALRQGSNWGEYNEEFTIYLWRESDITAMREVVNCVYSNCTVGDAIAANMNKYRFPKGVLMSPPNNERTIGQLIVPPTNLMNVLDELEDNYGVYTTGHIFFADLRCLYVLDKSGKCNAYEKEEYPKVIFTVFGNDTARHIQNGMNDNTEDKEYYIFQDIENVVINNKATTNDVIYGSKLMSIDAKNNQNTTISGASNSRTSSTRLSTNKQGTSFNQKRDVATTSEANNTIILPAVDNFNYFAITPNKSYVFNFTQNNFTQYDGYYRLTKTVMSFSRTLGNGMESTAILNFTQKEGLSADEKQKIDAKVVNPVPVTSEGKSSAAGKKSQVNAGNKTVSQSAEGKQAVKDAKKAASSNNSSTSTVSTSTLSLFDDSVVGRRATSTDTIIVPKPLNSKSMTVNTNFSADDDSTSVLTKSLANLDKDVLNPTTDESYLSEVSTKTANEEATDVAVYGTKPTPKPTPLFNKNKTNSSSGDISTTQLETEYTMDMSTDTSIKKS